MRRLAMSLLIAVGTIDVGHAQGTVGTGDAAAIREVIGAQIGAFRRDDGQAAFGYAAPNIQARFGDAATFLAAVRAGYPQVYRPGSFTFGGLAPDARGHEVQTVDLVAPDGARAIALYTMEHERDGRWRISGCELQTPPETAV